MAPRKKQWPPNGPTFLAEWREHRGYTQNQVAEMLGVSHTTIGRMESGDSPYQQHYLEALARIYDCTPADLISTHPHDAGTGADSTLKSALLAFGVHHEEIGQLLRVIQTYVVDGDDEQLEQMSREDQSPRASRRREPAP